jgi:CRP-like cAMP-binding protein
MPLSKGLKNYLSEIIQQVNYKKGEIFSQSGDFCDRIFILKKGSARGFLIREKTEITNWICLEKEFILSFESYFKNQVSKENFQALDDCYLDFITISDFNYCLNHFPEMGVLYRFFLEKYFMAAHDREAILRMTNASERFKYFKENFNPMLLEKIPSKYLASFLGMRPETFSRIHKE